MEAKTLDALIKKNKILRGKITSAVKADNFLDDYLVLDWDGLNVNVPREELDIIPVKGILDKWVGHVRYFVITGYDLETGAIYGSFKKYKEAKRDETLKRLKDEGKPVSATITRIFEWGAFLTYEKTTLALSNSHWASDYSTIGEYLKVGDKVRVKYLDTDEQGLIQVESVTKFEEGKIEDISFLKPRDVLIGRVRSVRYDRVYVKVARGIDVLCPIPPEEWCEEPSAGDLVAVRLTQVHPTELRLRGKIQGKLDSKEIEEKAGRLDKITYITKEEFVTCCDTNPDFVYGDIEKKSFELKGSK